LSVKYSLGKPDNSADGMGVNAGFGPHMRGEISPILGVFGVEVGVFSLIRLNQ
jgi:hypothetical protein